MGSTVDGLVSGMDTTSMIASMMKIEAAPQNLLKNKVATQQTAVSSYQSVNSQLSGLKNAARWNQLPRLTALCLGRRWRQRGKRGKTRSRLIRSGIFSRKADNILW